jgi:hypothetical protein
MIGGDKTSPICGASSGRQGSDNPNGLKRSVAVNIDFSAAKLVGTIIAPTTRSVDRLSTSIFFMANPSD